MTQKFSNKCNYLRLLLQTVWLLFKTSIFCWTWDSKSNTHSSLTPSPWLCSCVDPLVYWTVEAEPWGQGWTCSHRAAPAYTEPGCPHPSPWAPPRTALREGHKEVKRSSAVVLNDKLKVEMKCELTRFLPSVNGSHTLQTETQNGRMWSWWRPCSDLESSRRRHWSAHLTRPDVGLKPQMPQKEAGMRMLPPMSLPIPSREPPPAMRAPSPPDDPPHVFWTLWGLTVWP